MGDRTVLFLAVLVWALPLSAAEDRPNSLKGADLDVKGLALYVGVDGLCISTDGRKFGVFPEFADREATHVMEKAKLRALVKDLLDAGIEKEQDFALPDIIHGVPPITYKILIVLDERRIDRVFCHAKDCQVPDKYIRILSAALEECRDATLAKFIKQNQELHEATGDSKKADK